MTTTLSPGFAKDLLDPDGVAIIQQLQARGHESYFVGGSVRDLLLQRRPKDFDIATDARPEELKRIFGRRCRIIGRRFRLVHLHVGSSIFEIATFRGLPSDQEVATDDSGFVVRANTFGTAFEDAKSRDFTVNGLFYDPVAHLVIDHVGGLVDVERKVLRTIGDAGARLREDPVRLLRAVKFAARLGFSIDQPILDAAEMAAPLIGTCPAARVAEELYRMSESGYARESFAWMSRLGILDVLVPEIASSLAEGAPTRPGVLAWLSQLDRLTGAHGTLPREATFALVAWPFVELELSRHPEAPRLTWGRFALDGVRELAVRLSVPIRHRYTLAGMADVLKRLRQTPPRRPHPGQLRAYGVPLALTALRMGYLLTGQGQAAYDLWATELERLGLWAAPFEPRQDEDGGDGPQVEVDRGIKPIRPPATQAVPRPLIARPPRPVRPTDDDAPHDERAIDAELTDVEPLAAEVAAQKKRRRRRRKKAPGAAAPSA
ncbi:MAG: polynucleotide adenylyltransferase PcnB [Deltaproteobacteria bacterium]|nr:polynucleotide adenylyltransferase PcnB [Deltaproteobacteria bacterium]